jgi:hypothetical protein
MAQCISFGYAQFKALLMIDTNKLCRKATLVTSLAVALFTCFSCSANQDKISATNSGNNAADQDNLPVVKKMNPNEQIAYSKQDLATRLGLTVDAIKVSGATPVSWRSGALGCPKPGMSYTDVLVPGIWIVLRVDKVIYRYHGVPGGQPFYCPNDRAEPPVMGSGAD